MRRNATTAFTIIELLIVMSIILVLAGLILATSSYVQKKGQRSRAEAEIAALSAALESYKADNGIYPSDMPSSESLLPNDASQATNPENYTTAGKFLYVALSGDSDGDPRNGVESKTYFPGLKQSMLSPNPPNEGTYIRDPFGYSYGYSTAKAAKPSGPDGYNPTFDLWSTTGPKETNETFQQFQQRWIKNW